jgi:predicted naringenin-chalcone synthase
MKTGTPHIASIAVATPPCRLEQSETEQIIRRHYNGRLNSRNMSLIKTLLAHPSIKRRCFAVDQPETLVDEDPDARIERFTHWSVELSSRAIIDAMRDAGISATDVEGMVVNTCTGYICPGISTYLIAKLGLRRSVRVYDLVGSGCGGAIPNLEVAGALLSLNGGGPVLSVSVEICTATYQMDNNLSLLLSNTLFGDGASAAVLWTNEKGLELVASASRYIPDQRDAIRYVHKRGQLHNQLSLRLPELVARAAAEVVSEVLTPRSLKPSDIRHWALHSGGEKIINAVRDRIGLSEEQVRAARRVLEEYGNMSSPTVWFVLREIERETIASGEWCIMVAFGAGLSAHAFLLRKKK